MTEKRGSIAFFTTYRPPVALEIFSCPYPPTSKQDELEMTDGVSYNYNGHFIPPQALKIILKRPEMSDQNINEADVNSGRVSGMVFVSERDSLETLQFALHFKHRIGLSTKVFSFEDVFSRKDGVRMEDSPCIAGDYLVYVSTKEPASTRRQPWTAVYKTNLNNGITERITPSSQADLSPSVSPSGKKIAVASFENKGGWNGEVQDLQTAIYVMNVEKPYDRRLVVDNGGWPTWGSDNVLFFHRKVGNFWGVFRADISRSSLSDATRVTPTECNAMTPAAIDATTVAVAMIQDLSKFGIDRKEELYRHIIVFDSTKKQPPMRITNAIEAKADHFNPFVNMDGGKKRIGYHRVNTKFLKSETMERQFHKIKSPCPDIGLFRLSGAFPTFSNDGKKLAFVDNEFKSLWIADHTGLHVVYETDGPNNIFCPVWNQNSNKDIMYVCIGPSFSAKEPVDICLIPNASKARQHDRPLTDGFNNAFPSTNPEGTRLVFRSTRDFDGNENGYKNLYIMEDAESGDFGGGTITRLTDGPWIDTHCQWSPSGNWIVFSSSRDKPGDAPPKDHKLDIGFFAVFLVNPDDPTIVIRVFGSGGDVAGHVNHPFFSPDGMSIVVTADLAAVSVDPISLPLIEHSARPYGDIFTFDIDPEKIKRNENVKKFNRLTHSRYENSTGTWTMFSTQDRNAVWNRLLDGHKNWRTTRNPGIPRRCR